MPDLANVHIDVALTNISIAYMNEDYVADMVFPRFPVALRSDKYFVYSKDAFLKSSGLDVNGKPNSIRRPGTRSTEISYDLSTNSYYAEQLARNYPLTDAEVRLADTPLSPAIDATMALTETVTLDNEIAVAGKVGKRSNYAASNKVQLVNGSTSWAASTSHPLSIDLQNGKKAVIQGLIRAATHVEVNYNTAVTLSQNPEYVVRIQYVSKEALTEAGLLPILVGLKVVEARPQKATNFEGTTGTSGFAWVDDQGQDTALVYYKNSSPAGLRSVHFGATFDAPDDSLGGRGFLVKRWREEWADVERIEVRTTRDWRFIGTDGSTNGDGGNGYATGGYLISGTTL